MNDDQYGLPAAVIRMKARRQRVADAMYRTIERECREAQYAKVLRRIDDRIASWATEDQVP